MPATRRRASAPPCALALAALALVAAASAAASPATEAPPPDRCPGAGDASAPAAVQQSAMRCLVNAARAAHGLPPLSPSPILARSAAQKNALMLGCDQFAHDACGRPWYAVFSQAGYRGAGRGENIAWASADAASPREIMAAWLRSPGHRANILSPGWTEQAVSVRVAVGFQGQADATVWTSQFGRGEGSATAAGRP